MCGLFSYVVEHDCGIAPNPEGRYCTLVRCKPKIIKLANKGDWIVGTGGKNRKNPEKSAGHGKLVYAMKVDHDPIPVRNYCRDKRFQRRVDAEEKYAVGKLAIVSSHFFYFGRKAIPILPKFRNHSKHPLEKRGPGHRSRFSPEFIEDFIKWIEEEKRGRNAGPCWPEGAGVRKKCK